MIRDESRVLLAAFSTPYGLGSNSYAELRSLIDGVWMCHEIMNYLTIQIECDFRTVVDT